MMSGTRMITETIYINPRPKPKTFRRWAYEQFESFCSSFCSVESDTTQIMCHSVDSREASSIDYPHKFNNDYSFKNPMLSQHNPYLIEE